MTTDIFLSDFDPDSNHHLVVEACNGAVWAYLLSGEDQKILAHGLVCSQVEPVDEMEEPTDKTMPPPLVKRFANDHSVIPDLTEEQISIEWAGQKANVFIDGILYLAMDIDTRRAQSKSLSLPGRYGFPLED
ncbi:hypothetical protein GP486_008693 [Trichoglossum hirsutum]|uniref:Uncharacterized protein n=1 Tax=Trichoglossum hirsutum TaxID=265104 RepID=A0A9P8I6J4_9PEZI|nr:hypothetical protein GP486_008693 [Trichoglossum hirsutum]